MAILDTYASDGRTIVQIFRTTNGGVTWRLLGSRPTPLSVNITMLRTKEALLQTARHVPTISRSIKNGPSIQRTPGAPMLG